ncbi:MAG: ATP-binding protein [Bryobacteraceae bacterium]|jgi:hypothetical protein
MKQFDLNIEKVLEDWDVRHALREVIANALDEQALTKTKDVDIFKDKQGQWHVRDFGRGLKYEHLTQKEDQEKLSRPDLVVGKFGVGLKDALATFDRRQIKVLARSAHADITTAKSRKHGFEDVTTLHAVIDDASEPGIVGTDFIFEGVADGEMAGAKDLFLRFSGDTPIETTQYGQVLDKGKRKLARIYITGLRVAEEENFLCSYNITSVNAAIRKALNRERTNVGRTAYTERVKAILLECRQQNVAQLLVDDLKNYEIGTSHDELTWIDIQVHACTLLNATSKVIFLTAAELMVAKEMADRAKKDGYTVVTIPASVKGRIHGLKDVQGEPMRDLEAYATEWNESFQFKFVGERELTRSERAVFAKTDSIFGLIGGRPKAIKQVLISETMRTDTVGYQEASGIWEPGTQRVIVKRDRLTGVRTYASTLLHETAHATSGATDVSEEFERELTELIGAIAEEVL